VVDKEGITVFRGGRIYGWVVVNYEDGNWEISTNMERYLTKTNALVEELGG
jgi:hypothetical protein